MTDRTRSILIFAVLVAALSMMLCLLPGCQQEQIDGLLGQRQTVAEVRAATTQAVAEIQDELLLLPADDPVRQAMEDKLLKAQAVLAKADGYLAKADAAIRAAESGDLDDPALREAVRDIPYGPLILAVASIGFGVWQRIQKQQRDRALRQVVAGVEAVLPIKTAEQKLKLAAPQDAATKALITEIKGG